MLPFASNWYTAVFILFEEVVGSTAVFILFYSDMSYLMEKSCAYFVAQTKASNEGVYPIEFDMLVGKMIFTIDKGVKLTSKSDGSFRVKSVCLDPKIIETFVAHGPYVTSVKAMYQLIDVDSDELSDNVDVVPDSQPLIFLERHNCAPSC
ncbi:unnamed protein product [Trifolium pratense]|uniref:Uncharacterized protein n=1 Tax=Trifolium pratense TaxID=57577 RepID=A0ACB0IPI8_TRIPR|nr:unnamed protein product [Trifolium pratense]